MRIKISLLIAREECRYWRRSKLALVSSISVLLVLLASVVSTTLRIETERMTRQSFQSNAEETFKSQPARHPHRMVHYGHYVFRSPAPLALIDPGVDNYTGTILFLEGHRHNSAVFSPRYSVANAGPFSEVTPAFAYHFLVPLILIIVGFASISREHEGKTTHVLLASGVKPVEIWLGKTFALTSFTAAMLVPLIIALVVTCIKGESAFVALVFFVGYVIYLLFWVFLVVAVSALARCSTNALAFLLAIWVLTCVIIPRSASSAAGTIAPLDGKLTIDMQVTKTMREKGDGHNANDPAFNKFRAELLGQYNVEQVEDLPINFRGIIAKVAEADLTKVLNAYADERIRQEKAQTDVISRLSVLSPTLAVRSFSIITASTDLSQHHRFLRDAEALRFDFVQRLNQLHVEELSYEDDIRRSSDTGSEQRTRVSADNWQLLKSFPWQPNSIEQRIYSALYYLLILLFWCLTSAFLGLTITKRLFRNDNH